MSAVKELKAVARDRVGKGAARAVRLTGQVPAVIYGGGEPPRTIALNANDTQRLVYAGHFLTTVFEVDLDGSKTRVIPRDYQLDPVKDTLVHVDFLRLAAGQTLTIEIPVHFVGHETSPGLKRGGTLNVVRHTVELVVPSDAIPESIEADLSTLDMGDSLHISAMKLPNGVRTVIDRDFTVATIAAPTALGAEAEAEAAAITEAAKAESAKP